MEPTFVASKACAPSGAWQDSSGSCRSEELLRTIEELLEYCRSLRWAGYDPYDALNSRLLRRLGLFESRILRLAFTQFLKRCPINLRGFLQVPPEQNPKGMALFAMSLVRLNRLGLARIEEARSLVDELAERRCPGQVHACWGYHFDWQTRTVLVPSTTPNIVCTTFVANAFLDLYDATGHRPYLELARSAGRFVTDELASDLPVEAFCIRYYMVGPSSVHNASLLGAALLARLHGYQSEARLEEYIVKAVRFSLDRQRPDGSWPYGEQATQAWVDSFHTGYNLLALREIGRNIKISGLEDAVRRGYNYYRRHFFRADGAVRYFHNETYPVDAHAVGHALVALAEFSECDADAVKQAGHCYSWAISNLRSGGGWFYYQKRRFWTNRISYMRWSQAWMLAGLTRLAEVSMARPVPRRNDIEVER